MNKTTKYFKIQNKYSKISLHTFIKNKLIIQKQLLHENQQLFLNLFSYEKGLSPYK